MMGNNHRPINWCLGFRWPRKPNGTLCRIGDLTHVCVQWCPVGTGDGWCPLSSKDAEGPPNKMEDFF